MTLPNLLTLLRIFITPAFLAIAIYHESMAIPMFLVPWILFVIWLLSELSDAFDGYLARKRSQVTDLGKVLDPAADSIWRLTLFLSFTAPPVELPMWLFFVFLYRDSVIATLRTACALCGLAVGARTSGKLKAIVQAIVAGTIVILMIPQGWGWISLVHYQMIAYYLSLFAAILAVYAAVEHLWVNRSTLRILLTHTPTNPIS